MFTGIIREIGKLNTITGASGGKRFTVGCRETLEGLTEGASVAIDGACLTVESIGADHFEVFVSEKTFGKTALAAYKRGTAVNLEKSLRAGDELGGHIVLGHVDGVGKVGVRRETSGTLDLEISIPSELTYGVIPEGSIAVNGVSLTIASIQSRSIRLVIIPFTVSQTTLRSLKTGDLVNIEIDVLGKYMYKFYKEGTFRKP